MVTLLVAVNPLAERVVGTTLRAGVATLIVGVVFAVVLAIREVRVQDELKAKAKETADKASPPDGKEGPAAAQSLSSAFSGVAEFAKALKELDHAARVLVVAIALFAVAGVTAAADAIRDGGDDPPADTETEEPGS